MTTTNPDQALRESKPPATDPFTYLTIIGEVLSPKVLPTLHEILQDAQLTQEIGWDLVGMLVPVQGSEQCLRAIAQLGNPREVIIKVLEALEQAVEKSDQDEADEADEEKNQIVTRTFVTLLGMLSILHSRLKVRQPSRFVHSTLQAVLRAYRPHNSEMTAAVIGLVRSLWGEKRPPLPNRQSSTKTMDTPFTHPDATENAPDPEAMQTEEPASSEPALVKRLLQSFITCVVEAYVNASSLEWGSRLLEFYNPEKVVFRKSVLRAFKDDDTLQARDALVGQLVATAGDLGLSTVDSLAPQDIFEGPVVTEPLAGELDYSAGPDGIALSTGGIWCLIGYWIFAREVFDADHDQIQMSMIPDLFNVLRRFIGEEDSEGQIRKNPGTAEALLVIGLWLDNAKRVAGGKAETADFMPYHHQLTLISVFHPSLSVRNVATTLAGIVLHSDPDPQDRLKILEDLLENCVFSALQASAVSWLREEMLVARETKASNPFSSKEVINVLQHLLFPDLTQLNEEAVSEVWEFWAQNHPYHLQVASFAYLLFNGEDFKGNIPEGLGPLARDRYAEPLLKAGRRLRKALEDKELDDMGMGTEALMQLDILAHQLGALKF
ncbi:DUF1760-domain-containing protein [Sodiomyces alkalinus F11]|uniref:DUF1760-domain-containing protein n=1 Tax=Sodiomyces alkalinus (strain CBS 110278 / VKM F-3762 / F11) TaxID=1314773 RepID=A0A3N2PN57_SODAK|nr:DUF1760-domain-containing protein [Sodiomyces alkalinus F11]ROT35971.1 DUF1760-domain-containing protein [Sodiomyces alkalinus F11]